MIMIRAESDLDTVTVNVATWQTHDSLFKTARTKGEVLSAFSSCPFAPGPAGASLAVGRT